MSNPPRRRSSKTLIIPPLIALGNIGKAESFTFRAPSQPAARPALDKMHASCPDLGCFINEDTRSSTALGMIPGIMTELPTFNLADAATSSVDFLNDIGSTLIADSGAKTAAESEGMNLMSHALLDVPAMVAKATVAAKAAEVAGRLFVLGQVMLPGHEVMPDELAFQVGFLAVSCNALYRTVMPKIKAAQASKYLTPGDRKAYRSLFEPAGLSWTQYKEMSLSSMEWIELQPGQAIEDDATYWLHQGGIEVEGQEANVSSGLLGEDHIAKILGLSDGKDTTAKTQKAAVAGSEGATLLRMNTQKLGKMMKTDTTLHTPVSRLLFNNMQDKLERVSVMTQAA